MRMLGDKRTQMLEICIQKSTHGGEAGVMREGGGVLFQDSSLFWLTHFPGAFKCCLACRCLRWSCGLTLLYTSLFGYLSFILFCFKQVHLCCFAATAAPRGPALSACVDLLNQPQAQMQGALHSGWIKTSASEHIARCLFSAGELGWQ